MANEEHLAILKQGVEVWNRWRQEHREVHPDLSEAKLSKANLVMVNLAEANLLRADLLGAVLSGATLSESKLIGVNLRQANLSEADLSVANLINADLSEAKLGGVDLNWANLFQANLSGADLRKSNLLQTNLSEAKIRAADLSQALMWQTILSNLDLSQTKGLDTVIHDGPSDIGIQTIYKSNGEIPEIFLRGAGVPNSFIEYARSLVGKPIDYYSAFISYSSKDQAFAERLYEDLQGKGVRCWFAPEDLKIGDKLRPRIDEAIHKQEKLLLLLSEHALDSTWVETEVEAALDKEQRQQREVLFPIRLDESVLHTQEAWAAQLRRQRHIGDFTRWKDPAQYQQAFTRLLRDLKA